jgi:predicted RNA-binding protein with RPS1 domain
VKEENIKAIEVPTFEVDDTVEAVYPDDENWYTGVVKEVKGDDAYVVAWDDSDGGPESSTVKATDMRAYVKRIPLKDLQRKQKMKGTVTSIREFGAFVDVGAERDGLVHVSNMPRVPDLPYQVDDYVEALFKDEENGDEWYTGTMKEAKEDGTYVVEWDDPGDGDATSIVKGDEIRLHQPRCAVAEGDEIDVWVRDVQAPREEGMDWRLGLTMFEKSPLTAFEEVPANQWIKGKVVRAASFGAFVEITAPNGMVSTGLCHVSQMRDGYVENAEDEVEIGSEVNVRVLSVDLDRERISLSFKDDNVGGGYEDDGGY